MYSFRIDFTRQVAGADDEKMFSKPRMNTVCNNKLSVFLKFPEDAKEVETIWEAFERGVRVNPSGNYLGTRKYTPEDAASLKQKLDKYEEELKKYYVAKAKYDDDKKAAASEAAASAGDEAKSPTFAGEKSPTAASAAAAASPAKPPKPPVKPSGYVEKNGVIERGAYTWATYKEVYDEVVGFGKGLIKIGARPFDNLGIFAVNRAEWMIASLGFYSQSMRTVALYATLGENAVQYIINHAETAVVVVSRENLPSLIATIGQVKKTLKHIIVMDSMFGGRAGDTVPFDDFKAQADKCEEHGIHLHNMTDIINAGKADGSIPLNPPKETDLAFLMYTSGTTGDPKGAELSHGAIITSVGALGNTFIMGKDDRHLSYLPLAHIFETLAQVYALSGGASVGFSQGEIRKLADDITTLRPTLFCGVPRVYQKFYQGAWENISKLSCIKRCYIANAFKKQVELINAGKTRNADYDTKVFNLVRTKLGLDKCKILITGAAPCPDYLMEFLRVFIGCHVVQGYGMTETSAAISATLPKDMNTGHCGPPIPCCEVKLAEIPEMGYSPFGTPGTRLGGEIVVRGRNLFNGYFKNPEETKKTFLNPDAPQNERWLCTGDVGRWNANGTLSIIDRRKNMIKLAQGEYIALEKVETSYEKCPLVGQFWLYGNSYRNVVVAVVVPSAAALYAKAQEMGWWPANVPESDVRVGLKDDFIQAFAQVVRAKQAEIAAWLLPELQKCEKGLSGFEKIKGMIVEGNINDMGLAWTAKNDTMTESMKKRRRQLTDMYVDQLKSLYAKVDPSAKAQANEKW